MNTAFENSKDLRPNYKLSAESIEYIRDILNDDRQALLDEINVNHII